MTPPLQVKKKETKGQIKHNRGPLRSIIESCRVNKSECHCLCSQTPPASNELEKYYTERLVTSLANSRKNSLPAFTSWSGAMSSRRLHPIGWLGVQVLPYGVVVHGGSHGDEQVPDGMGERYDAVAFEEYDPQAVEGATHKQLVQA